MSDMPDGTTYGYIEGFFGQLVEDGADDNDLPDLEPVSGSVELKPSVPYVIYTDPVTGAERMIMTPKETYPIGEDGRIRVKVVATDNAPLNPTAWTYSASVHLKGYDSLTTSVSVPGGSTVSLTHAIGAPVVPGAVIITNAKGDTGPRGPQGEKGDKGDTGPANQLTVASTTTGAPGTPAKVSVSGVSPNQALAFTIPQGTTGDKGERGLTGPKGDSAVTANTVEIRGTGSPYGTVTPTEAGIYYTDVAGTCGAWRWMSTGTTSTSWVVIMGDTGWRDVSSLLTKGSGLLVVLWQAGGRITLKGSVVSGSSLRLPEEWIPFSYADSFALGKWGHRSRDPWGSSPGSLLFYTAWDKLLNFDNSEGLMYDGESTWISRNRLGWPVELPGKPV